MLNTDHCDSLVSCRFCNGSSLQVWGSSPFSIIITTKIGPEFPGCNLWHQGQKELPTLTGSNLELLIFLVQRQFFVDVLLFLLIILVHFKKYCLLTHFTYENCLYWKKKKNKKLYRFPN